MARVLLVDDSAYVASFFAVQLWDEHQLDVVTTAAQIPSHPTTHWDVAFVDFELNRSASGLTALKHLQGRVTHPVAFTGSGESGRGLFNIAANRWFGVRVIIDKSDARPLTAIVSSLLAGHNPSHVRLVRDRDLLGLALDTVFRDSDDVLIWRALDRTGSTRAAATFLGKKPYVMRDFKDEKSDSAELLANALNDQLLVSAGGSYIPRSDIIMHFAGANRVFINVPDLEDIIRWRNSKMKNSSL